MNRFFRTVTGTNNQGTGTTVLNPIVYWRLLHQRLTER